MIKRRIRHLLRALPFTTIDRYLMRQFLISYGVCAVAVLGLFILVDGVSRLDHFLKIEKSLAAVLFQYFTVMTPVYYTQFLAPVLTLLAGMFTVTLLNKGSEIVPLKGAGLSVQRILAPFFVLALGFTILMMVSQEYLLPALKTQIRQATAYSKRSITEITLQDSLGKLITVKRYYPERKAGEHAEIRDRSAPDGSIVEHIRAKEIQWSDEQRCWELRYGSIVRFDADGRPIGVPQADGKIQLNEEFTKRVWVTDLRPVDFEASDRDITYLDHKALSHQIRRRAHLKHIEVKLHRRYAFPLANFILLLLGLPFVFRGENKSVILGIGVAIAISALYLSADFICADLGNKGAMPPIIAAWLPVLFFGALGLTLFDGIES